jgi:hypothetical protein
MAAAAGPKPSSDGRRQRNNVHKLRNTPFIKLENAAPLCTNNEKGANIIAGLPLEVPVVPRVLGMILQVRDFSWGFIE